MDVLDYRSCMLNLLKENAHLKLVNGEEALTAVGLMLMLSTIHRSAENEREKANTGNFLLNLMERVEQAGYRHWRVLERMLLDGTPTKHFESGQYFQDGDEVVLMMEMCGDALNTLGETSGEVISQLLGNASSSKH